MQNEKANPEAEENTFVEGLDYYFEDGLLVLTRHYLLKRGYCCHNDCRHCPYEGEGSIRS